MSPRPTDVAGARAPSSGFDHDVTSCTAGFAALAILRGRFEVDAVAATLARLRGRETKAARALARRLVARFGEGRRPRQSDVARFLRRDAGFGRIAHHLAADIAALEPPTMQPAAGVPRTWSVPSILSPAALATWLGIDGGELLFLAAPWRTDRVEPEPRRRHYHVQWVARRHGLPRLIEAPKQRLKDVQRRILAGILDHVPAHPAAHGFVSGRNTASFADPHAGKACVLRMDVQDFFVSFGRARVLRVFATIGFPEVVAGLLADLCTTWTPRAACDGALADQPRPAADVLRHKLQSRHLPQGAPTSPALANLCAFALDRRLSGLAARFGARYTRYADDLLFSGSEDFARAAHRCETYVGAILLQCGLQAAHRKTKTMHRSVSQRAAGLVLNERPGVPRRERERLEAILVNCVRRGVPGQNRDGHPDFRAHLLGRIAQVAHLHPRLGAKLRDLFARIRWSADTHT